MRFSDVDLLGHVNNVRYFDYVHEAQVEVLTGVFQEARVSGTVDTVVARSEMDHVGQMNLRSEPYDVWSRVAGLGRTSVTLEAEIRDGDRVMARSRVVEVNVDGRGKPLPWHPQHRALFEKGFLRSATQTNRLDEPQALSRGCAAAAPRRAAPSRTRPGAGPRWRRGRGCRGPRRR